MSKKLITTGRWKDQIRRRQLAELRKSRHTKRGRSSGHVARSKDRFFVLHVPVNFSLRKNPDDVIYFLNQIEYFGRGNNLELRFAEVQVITPEAIAALIATIRKRALAKRTVRGDLPKCEPCRQILEESGFFDHVRLRGAHRAIDRGSIQRRQSNRIEPVVAKELIASGTQQTGKEHSEASYRILIEGMGNTLDHASPPPALPRDRNSRRRNDIQYDREMWWAMAYADVARSRVCFVFLDTGVGIFNSVKIKTLRKIAKAFRLTPDSELLNDLLHGRLGSRTGLPYRGKGLPAIRDLSARGEVKELTLITNAVFADVSSGEYKSLSAGFRGTLLYWEI